jgi:NAD-dependent dihydropyrimidine dehydrogenase PreA subunit
METCAQCKKMIFVCPTKSQSVARISLGASNWNPSPDSRFLRNSTMETCAQCKKMILGCPNKSQSVAQSSLCASKLKSEPGFGIFVKFDHGNMCTTSKNDFGVPYKIKECRAKFSGCLEIEIRDRIRDFREILPWKHVHNVKNWFWGALPNHRVSGGVPWVPRNEIRAWILAGEILVPLDNQDRISILSPRHSLVTFWSPCQPYSTLNLVCKTWRNLQWYVYINHFWDLL